MKLFEKGEKNYYLKNGEVVSVPHEMKFIVETDTIKDSSPALISRM
jgi:hypothetical protein